MAKMLLRFAFAALALLARAASAETVQVLSYHDFPPFVESDGAGLSRELCARLTARSAGRYRFALVVVPRRRFDAMLEQRSGPVLVPWVSPDFFPAPARFRWGDALMPDSVVMLTMPGSSIDLGKPETLSGVRFGAISGHRYNYPGLKQALKAGRMVRSDSVSPSRNYGRLLNGRLDMTIMSESTFHFLRNDPRSHPAGVPVPLDQQLGTSVYHRTYFTLGTDAALEQFLKRELDALRVVRGIRPAWRIQEWQP